MPKIIAFVFVILIFRNGIITPLVETDLMKDGHLLMVFVGSNKRIKLTTAQNKIMTSANVEITEPL